MLSALQNLTRPGKKKQDQLEGLNRLAAAISSSLDLDNVLQETMQVASDLTGAGVCRIYLPDEQEQKLLLKTSLNSIVWTS